MAVTSMTGFARGEGAFGACAWNWEVRSVNARGLEIRCRMPVGFEGLEPAARQRVSAHLTRGNVLLTLGLTLGPGAAQVRINEGVLEQVLTLLPRIQERIQGARQPTAAAILGLRGVIDVVDGSLAGEERTEFEAEVLATLDRVLNRLADVRRAEGARLQPILETHVLSIAALCAEAGRLAATQPDFILARLKEQIAALIDDAPALPADRLAQEAALLAIKADPREELDRIRAHFEAVRTLIATDGPIGRQLDFLCQELNREANTLCAKSADVELTRVGIALKTRVDQLREQVQNIE